MTAQEKQTEKEFEDFDIKEFIGIEKETGNYYGSPKEFDYFVLIFKDMNNKQIQLSILSEELRKIKEVLK